MRERAQQVQRRGRLVVGLASGAADRACALPRELRAVDDVAAIARQLDAVLASRSSTSAAWRTGRRCGRPSPPATPPRRSAPPTSAGRRGRSRGSSSRCGPRSSRRSRRPAAGKPRRPRRARATSSGCAPRRQTRAAETTQACVSTAASFAGVRVVRDLDDRLRPPAFGRPALGHDAYSLQVFRLLGRSHVPDCASRAPYTRGAIGGNA